MTSGSRSFFGRRQMHERASLARLKTRTRAILDLPEDATVAVNEIVCADPSCPGIETVILIMEPGRKTRAVKLRKGADEIGEIELCSALVASTD